MQALLLTRPNPSNPPTLTLTRCPKPVPPAGHILVRVYASAVQPSDKFNAKAGFASTTFPRIPGRDFSGVVASGPDEGVAVFGTSGPDLGFTADGAHAEFVVVAEDAVARKPVGLSHERAACLGVPLTTAWLAIEAAGVGSGDQVAVLGARGAVGEPVCALLRRRQCRILAAIRGPGADIDTVSDPGLTTVRKKTDSEKGVAAVIDTVGDPGLTRAAVEEALAHKGRLVLLTTRK
ncbi:GroES-like protein [Ophiocordyceps camponoti-floridani]|uniref:GroES-like protein n=1 Tax=Ophiocordyceps camponoti-floridani TaxID=2030778 RepID=A0A8H4Q5Q3_9HYPO|nr:GroES-like protein [Ophiocordyceps camponoti-floridani]